MRKLRSSKKSNSGIFRNRFRKCLIETLAARELLAANVMDDTVTLTSSGNSINVLTNDTNGAEVQNVSAFNADYDRSTYLALRDGNDTDWFIPERPGQSGVPQRSLIVGAVMAQDGRADGFNGGGNRGDLDLLRDNDADPSNDASLTEAERLTIGEGMVLATLRENYSVASQQPFNEPLGTNVGVIQYASEGGQGATTWIAQAAGPENNGERSSYFGASFFPYDAGWVGASFSSDGSRTSGSTDISTVRTATGRYEATVTGVTDSFNDGFLFAIGGDNEDNYTRAQPIEGGKWRIAHRDNAAEINGGENDDFNLMYFPRGAQGLVGGTVRGGETIANPMLKSFGDFNIVRESDGFWRLSIPGHSPTSGVLVMETHDLTTDQPRNSYFSYVQAETGNTDDFIIRQFTWDSNTETPQNLDFSFFFVPFENTMNPTAALNIVSAGTNANPTGLVSEQGVQLAINADGTINYQDNGAIAGLTAGQTATDTFVYDATDGTETNRATATINWIGFNDRPEVVNTIDDQVFTEDEAARTFDLAAFFNDPDNGDVLTYTVEPGPGGFITAGVTGAELSLAPAPNRFGLTSFTVTATDQTGLSASFSVEVSITTAQDDPVAVDDADQTDKLTAIDIDAIVNDFHPDTAGFAVAAAEIFGNTNATGNGDTAWSIVASSAAPNELTIQSPQNRGDVEIGRNGFDLFQSDGVLLGTVRDNTSPFQTVNTYGAFGSYGFATDTGIGGGERNSPLSAGFFPFAEGWVSGQVAASGDVISGVGISDSNVTKRATGLWEITIPGVPDSFNDSGMLFAMSGSNDDNIMSVRPQIGGGWLVGQRDSDSAIGTNGEWNGEDDAWSFVYIPGDTPNLIGGQYAVDEEGGGGFVGGRNYGSVDAVVDGFELDASILLTIPGYTPAQGALIAVSSGFAAAPDPATGIIPPAAHAVLATPDGNSFRVQSHNAGDYSTAAEDFYFVFLPFDQPLIREAGLDIDVTSVQATSALGAAVVLNNDGTINYNPAASSNTAITGLGVSETVEDTFTYTISDQRSPAGTSVATVTVTVTGENQAPTASNDTVNLSEDAARDARLTLTGNDLDPDFDAIYGTPTGIASANLDVDGSGNWSVAATGTGANQVSLGTTAVGEVEVLAGGSPIAPTDGVVIASVRQNYDNNADFRLVQAFTNGTGGTSLSLKEFATDNAADAPVSMSYFRFADNWVGGHVDGVGALTAGNGVAGTDVTKLATGRYEVAIPGLLDANHDGFLLAVGNENADNVVSVQPIPGTNRFAIAVRDNQQNFGDGEDGGFSFVFIPRTAANLVAGSVDAGAYSPNSLNLAIGEYTIERLDVSGGGNEWKLSIPGQSPATGMLVLSNDDTGELEDNYLTYQDDGAGSFIIRNQDMPGLGRQSQPFSFVFVPFEAAAQPVFRPVPSVLSVSLPNATSAQGVALSIDADGTVKYSPGTIYDALYDGDTATDTFTYNIDDGFGGTSSATATVNIVGVGRVVQIQTSDGTTEYILGDTGFGVDSNISLTDSPTPFLNGATIVASISAGGLATDVLAVRNEGTGAGKIGVNGSEITFEGTVIGTFTGGTGGTDLTITLNAAATLENTTLLLQAISFSNADAATPEGTRTVSFLLTDQNGKVGTTETKDLQLVRSILRTSNFQQGINFGYGAYTGTEDVNLRENSPNGVDQATDHLIDFNNAGAEAQVLIEFGDLFGTGPGQIPNDAIITSANLVVETNPATANAPGDGARFLRMLTDWNETDTWASLGLSTGGAYDQWGIVTDGTQARQTFDSMIGTASGAGSTGTGFLSVSVLPDIKAWQGGETNFGWVFKGWEDRTDGWFFSSSEDETPTSRPRLEIDWIAAGNATAVSFQDGVNEYTGTVDTDIRADQPDADNSASETVFVDDPGRQTLIRFEDIFGSAAGQIPVGSQIVTARLTTSSMTSNAQGDGGRFYPILADWSDTSTYNSLGDGISPDGTEALTTFNTAAGNASRNPNVQGGRHTWDVTADLQAWSDGDIANKGWAITPWESGTDGWGFQTSEAPEQVDRPRLEVYWTEAASDSVAPEVENVFVSSTNWAASFIDTVDGGGAGSGNGLGFELTAGAAPLPWNDVNTVYIQFSENVINTVAANFELRNSQGVLSSNLSYDPDTFRATITLDSALAFEKFRIGVSDQVTDEAGNPLDGNSDGTSGGIFDFRFDVVPADANRDGRVNGSDLAVFSAAFLAQSGSADYNPFADWNADDRVNGSDLAVFSANFLNNIDTVSDPAAAFSGGGGAPDFGSRGGNGSGNGSGGSGSGDSDSGSDKSLPSFGGTDGYFADLGDEDEEDNFLMF